MRLSTVKVNVISMLVLGMMLVMGSAASAAAKASAPAQAAESTIANSITVNPFGFIGWGPDIEYERTVSPFSGFALRVKPGGFTIGDWKTTALGFGGSWRFFPHDEDAEPAPAGLWLGPALDVLTVSSSYRDSAAVSSVVTSIYGQLGYKWVFGKTVGFELSPYMNLGYSMGSLSVGDNKLTFTGVMFGIGLALGIGF